MAKAPFNVIRFTRVRLTQVKQRFKGRSLFDIGGTMGLRLSAALLVYGTSLLLTNLLGVEGYGTYMFALALVNVLCIPAGFGCDKLLRREIAVYESKEQWALMGGLIRWANSAVFMISCAIALFAFLSFRQFSTTAPTPLQLTLGIALLSLPLRTLNRVRAATMQGLGRIVSSQVPEMLLQPMLLILGVLLCLFRFKLSISAPLVMVVQASAIVISLIVGTYLVRQTIPSTVKHTDAQYNVKGWCRAAMPMILISAMYVVENRTDTLMLGTMEGTASVGLYAVANKGAEAISYMLLAVNTAMASKFAKLYAQGDRQKLQKEVTKCTRIITSVAFPIGLGLIIFGTWFLQLFGSDFVAAKGALTVLCVSNLVNALVGSVSLLLIMSGHARYVSTTVTVTAGVNILLNFVLIPQFGVVGAAIATATSTILRNFTLEQFVRRKIGVHTSIFG